MKTTQNQPDLTNLQKFITPKGQIILQRPNNEKDVVIFNPSDKVAPFVYAHGYDDTTGTWGHGTYFASLNNAMSYATFENGGVDSTTGKYIQGFMENPEVDSKALGEFVTFTAQPEATVMSRSVRNDLEEVLQSGASQDEMKAAILDYTGLDDSNYIGFKSNPSKNYIAGVTEQDVIDYALYNYGVDLTIPANKAILNESLKNVANGTGHWIEQGINDSLDAAIGDVLKKAEKNPAKQRVVNIHISAKDILNNAISSSKEQNSNHGTLDQEAEKSPKGDR